MVATSVGLGTEAYSAVNSTGFCGKKTCLIYHESRYMKVLCCDYKMLKITHDLLFLNWTYLFFESNIIALNRTYRRITACVLSGSDAVQSLGYAQRLSLPSLFF